MGQTSYSVLTPYTANDFITNAYIELNVRGPGDAIPPSLLTLGLFHLNALLDRLSVEDYALFCYLTQTFTLVPGTSAYTIGTSGNPAWYGPRPVKIEDRCYITDSSGNNYGLDLMSEIAFNDIGTPNVESQIPDKIYYDPQYPNGIVNIWPIPMLNYTVTLISHQQLAAFPGGTTQFLFPPGYMEFFFTNLAISLAGSNGKKVSPDLRERARVSLASMKRANIRRTLETSDMEKEIQSHAQGTYNIYRDSSS